MADEETVSLTKEQILQAAITGREQEIMFYGINITNYEFAIEAIDAGPHDDPAIDAGMKQHRARLVDLWGTEKLEQAKAQLILDALRRQLSNG